MTQQQKSYKQIIHNRHKAILERIKKGKPLAEIERETALLVLDTINALQEKAISLKEGCGCFIRIDYALSQEQENKMSEDFRDLLSEAIILDEAGTVHGPDINLLMKLSTKILNRRTALSAAKIRNLVRVS